MALRLGWHLGIVICSVMLTACGGGGGDSSTPVASDGVVVTPPPAVDSPDPAYPGDNELELVMIPETEFDPHWDAVGVYDNAASCGSCHRASSDGSGVMRLPQNASGTDISPWAGWGHSMMAQAWSDPYYQAAVEGQAQEFPDYAGDIEDTCLSCHSPMAHTNAHDSGEGLSTSDCQLGGECYRMETSAQQNHAREGISCTLCHQMVDDGVSEPTSGNFSVAPEGDANANIIYGPYDNPRAGPMQNNTAYGVSQSDYISSSEHCGSCHDLDTPTFDINTGHPAAPAIMFREQAAYSEWLNSSYGEGGASERSCQDCHMQSPESYQTQIAIAQSGATNPGWPQRSPFSQHDVAGGNTYVLGLLQRWREELGIAASTTEAGFDAAIAKGRDMLGQAAQVTLESPSVAAGELQLAVRIANKTGHKLPTGYPSRRMWLQLSLVNAQGEVLFESGKPDENGLLDIDRAHMAAACLDVDKIDGFSNSGCYEPHRNEISDPGQVAMFQAVMADINGHINYSLLYSASYLKDNRIPPLGFSTSSSNFDSATAPVGQAVQDSDFNREAGAEGSGSDTVHYRLAVPEGTLGQLTVSVRLWYQSVSPLYVRAMPHRGAKSDRLRIMVREQPPLPELLAEDSRVVEF